MFERSLAEGWGKGDQCHDCRLVERLIRGEVEDRLSIAMVVQRVISVSVRLSCLSGSWGGLLRGLAAGKRPHDAIYK